MSTILLTTYYLLIPCSYLQVYTNIIVACQTTEVTYRSPTPSFLQVKPCADHHLSIPHPLSGPRVSPLCSFPIPCLMHPSHLWWIGPCCPFRCPSPPSSAFPLQACFRPEALRALPNPYVHPICCHYTATSPHQLSVLRCRPSTHI